MVMDSIGEAVNDIEYHNVLVPYKNIDDYMESIWCLDEDCLSTCEEFISRKILSTGALEIYKQKKYKTVEELSVKANLRIARIALIISLVSVLLGNILPLFQKQEIVYLDEINQKISVLEEILENNESNPEIINKMDDIQENLKTIEEKLVELEKIIIKEKKQQSLMTNSNME